MDDKPITVKTVQEPVALAPETIEALKPDESSRGMARSTDPMATKHEQDEQALTSLGQRLINLVWEHTQRNLAYYVVGVAVTVAAYLAIMGDESIANTAFTFLCTMAGSVIGFYFGRTNHQKIGGVRQGR